MRRPAAAITVLAVLMLLVAVPPAGAQEDVRVVNLPRVQEVSGTVTVREPVSVSGRVDATRFVAYEDREVPPLVGTPSVRDYTFIGTLDAGGFASAILSVAAWVPAGASNGKLGVLLVPDFAFAREALDRDGIAPIGLQAEVSVSRATAGRTVAASSERLALSFPRWRVYLYNTTSSTLKSHAYVMLGD